MKVALISLTKTMPLDYAVDGVLVNAICQAVVRTPMLQRRAAEQEREADITSYP
jgi:NAD(P)-dependent dehydrogenase (short-subunit alcohol dehydrogenase family)